MNSAKHKNLNDSASLPSSQSSNIIKKEGLIQEIVESLTRCQRQTAPSAWKALGLSHAQMGMLFMLFHHREANAKQIAEFLGISKSAISQLLDPLVDKKLVSRQVNPKDRRIVRLSLTSEGLGLLKKLNKLKFAGIRSALDSLSSKELDQLAALHRKMAQNVGRSMEAAK